MRRMKRRMRRHRCELAAPASDDSCGECPLVTAPPASVPQGSAHVPARSACQALRLRSPLRASSSSYSTRHHRQLPACAAAAGDAIASHGKLDAIRGKKSSDSGQRIETVFFAAGPMAVQVHVVVFQ